MHFHSFAQRSRIQYLMDSPFAMDVETYGFRMSNRQRRITFLPPQKRRETRRTIRTSPGASKIGNSPGRGGSGGGEAGEAAKQRGRHGGEPD